MASRVEYAVRVTPIVTMTSTDAADKDSIGSDVGKSLGGSAFAGLGGTEAHVTIGYAGGVVAYLEAVSGSKTQLGADNTGYDMVFIKNTGYVYNSATELGAASVLTLDVFLEYTAGSAWLKICKIAGGGAIILPKFPGLGSNLGIFVQPTSGDDALAVEYILVRI